MPKTSAEYVTSVAPIPLPSNFIQAAGRPLADTQTLCKTTKDQAPTDEVITGTGDSLPSEVGSKRLHNVAEQDLTKGSQRYDKHVRQKGSDQEKGASEGAQEEEVIDGVVGGR